VGPRLGASARPTVPGPRSRGADALHVRYPVRMRAVRLLLT